MKRGDELCEGAGRLAVEESNHWHSRLLRPRRERPRYCRAAEQRDDLAASHSITSSAHQKPDVL
jgi:hypothetical protein